TGTLSLRLGDEGPSKNVGLDGKAAQEIALTRGTWHPSFLLQTREGNVVLPGEPIVVPGPGGDPVRAEYDLRIGRCPVRIVDSSGAPVRGVVLQGEPVHAGTALGFTSTPTDSGGRTVLLGPVGSRSFRTRYRP